MSTEKKESLLSKIIEKGMDAIKSPFIVKRVVRAFESAKDSIEEQLMDKGACLNTARENLVNAAKKGENLKSYIQQFINLRCEINALKEAQSALETEKAELL